MIGFFRKSPAGRERTSLIRESTPMKASSMSSTKRLFCWRRKSSGGPSAHPSLARMFSSPSRTRTRQARQKQLPEEAGSQSLEERASLDSFSRHGNRLQKELLRSSLRAQGQVQDSTPTESEMSESRHTFEMEELISSTGKGDEPLRILLLANEGYTAGCCSDYIRAIRNNSSHQVTVRNPIPTSRLDKLLGRPRVGLKDEQGRDYGVVIIHYSICILIRDYVPRYLRKSLRAFKGIKIQVIQDEYRWVNRMMREMVHLGIDGILSLVDKDKLDRVYHLPELKDVLKVSSLAGYVSNEWVGLDSPPTASRSKHLIYRGNHLPYWLGHAAREKTTLTERYLENLDGRDLVIDLSSDPKDRIYGEDWLGFMQSGKAVVGLEVGRAFLISTSRPRKRSPAFCPRTPEPPMNRSMRDSFRRSRESVDYRMITPRSFESIAMKTVQVGYEGEYSGILRAREHYIPLKRDFSNANEVCGLLKDDEYLQKMADHAYREVIESGKFGEERLGLGIDSMIEYLVKMKKDSFHRSD